MLIKGAPAKRLWAGKYNGLGGHMERGEDILSSAQRELMEETGLTADLWLFGTVIVDAGETGICLYVFCGEGAQGEIKNSKEGSVEWTKKARVEPGRNEDFENLPLVEDLPILLHRIHQMKRGDPPFSARSYYDENEKLNVIFGN